MKTLLSFTICGLAALSAAQTLNVASPENWKFDYTGRYAFTAASTTGTAGSLFDLVLPKTTTSLGAQLALFKGDVRSEAGASVSLAQKGATVTTSPLAFAASTNGGLTSTLGDFLVNALKTTNGTYGGDLKGASLVLAQSSVAALKGGLDFRDRFGLGTYLNLEARLLGSRLDGTVTGVDGATHANRIEGVGGRTSTIGLFATADTYLTPNFAISGLQVQLGTIATDATSWSLSRNALPAQAVPEPGALAALGLGVVGLARRRRKAA